MALCVMVFGLFGSADIQAQVCKISDQGDNVEIFDATIIGNDVVVTVANDSKDIAANVTVTVEVTYEHVYGGGRTAKETLSGKGTIYPSSQVNQSQTIKIRIPQKDKYEPTSVRPTGISGTKCR